MNIDSDYKKQISIEISKAETAGCDAFGLLSLVQGDVLSWIRLRIEQYSNHTDEETLTFTYICDRNGISLLKAYLNSNTDFNIIKIMKSFSEFVIKNDMSHYLTDIEYVFTDGSDVYLIYTPFKIQKDCDSNAILISKFLEKLCLLSNETLSHFSALTEVLESGDCSLDRIMEVLSKSGEQTQSAEYDYGQTTLLQESVAIYNTPNLLRMNTNEKIYITKRNFIVGKSRSHADYTIENNVAISRVHAQFNCEGDEYFVVDKGSTNKTFVNGYMISPNYPIKIFDGDEIKMADEIFIFHLN